MRDEQSHDNTTADPHELAEADTGTRTEYRVEIEPNGKAASIGQRYKATFDGEVIVASSKDAEFDACRVLLDRGIAGTMVTFFPGGTVPRICLDIEKGAILSAVENATKGPSSANGGQTSSRPRRTMPNSDCWVVVSPTAAIHGGGR